MFEDEAQKFVGVEIAGYILIAAGELDFSLEGVAKKASLHPRILQKKLQAEGGSFQVLLSNIRQKLSVRYLKVGIDIATIAVYLGYSEASEFHRAFKKWYGYSPKEWLSRSTHDHPPHHTH